MDVCSEKNIDLIWRISMPSLKKDQERADEERHVVNTEGPFSEDEAEEMGNVAL